MINFVMFDSLREIKLKMKTLVFGVLFFVFAFGIADLHALFCKIDTHEVKNITRCSFSHDCRYDECCVNSCLGFKQGYCRKLQRRGESCSNTRAYVGAYGEKFWMNCPCRRGLTCMVNEPFRPLIKATTYNIYNMCLGPRQIKWFKMKRQTEVEEIEKTVAAEESTTIKFDGPDY